MLPFGLLLLCIAFLPLVLKNHWERYYHLIALFLAAITTAYYLFGIRQSERILHEGSDYIRFMVLVGSLFVVSGGIHVQVRRSYAFVQVHVSVCWNSRWMLCW